MTEQRQLVYDEIKAEGPITRSAIINHLSEPLQESDGFMWGNRIDRALQWLEVNGHIESDHRRCTCGGQGCVVTYEVKKK